MTATLVAGVRISGIVAPYVCRGAVNGATSRAYIEQMMAPPLINGEILIMDTASIHKVAGVAKAICGRGSQLLDLPAESPDHNPIEKAFSKLKALLRKAAARTKKALWHVVGEMVSMPNHKKCRRFFECCGYAT